MQLQLRILNEGDQVLNTWDSKISIKRKNGEVEIFTLLLDDNNLPRFSPDSVLITFGKGEVVMQGSKNVSKNKRKKNTSNDPDSDFEIMTF